MGEWRRAVGLAPPVTSIQEALRLPATKLYKAGTLNAEVRDLIEHNVRFSRQWWGDVQSQIASNITAERRIRSTDPKERIGRRPKQFQRRLETIRRARFLNAMEAMPNASVTVRDIYMEDDGFGDGPYRVQISLTKTPEKIVVDFAGTDPQSMSTVNCSEGVARAATYAPLLAALDPGTPLNQGVIDLIEFRAPRGCLVNPIYPAPCFASTADPGDRISETMQLAISKLLPERVTAGSYATGNNLTGGGTIRKTARTSSGTFTNREDVAHVRRKTAIRPSGTLWPIARTNRWKCGSSAIRFASYAMSLSTILVGLVHGAEGSAPRGISSSLFPPKSPPMPTDM